VSTKKVKTAKKPTQEVLNKPVRIRSAFDRERLKTKMSGESMTKQAFARDCHTPFIMQRFIKTGELPQYGNPQYGDQPESDFQEAQFAMARLQTLHQETDPEKPFDGFVSEILDSLTPESSPGEETPNVEGDSSPPANTERSDGGEAPSEERASQSS